MQNKFNINKLFLIFIISIILFLNLIIPIKSNAIEFVDSSNNDNISVASIQASDLIGKEFYIKNMYTGQYLDVSGGIAANGTNVQQYKFNGTDSQRWYMYKNDDSTLSLYSRVTDIEKTYHYALDINGGSAENYANVQIWEINGSDAQKFKMGRTDFSSIVFCTKVTDYSKAVVLNGPTCDQGRNVDQYTFQNHVNEMWILEPVKRNINLGYEYATQNSTHRVSAYPNCNNIGGDCANFVSQCLLASGIHYQNDWYVYRKNNNYSSPTTVDQLNNSWELSDPSPWISAKQFGKYWKSNVTYYKYKGSDITSDPSLAYNLPIQKGDVIQYATSILGLLGDSKHTMYITGYENSSYTVVYHSSDTSTPVNLLSICASHPDYYFIFYDIN